MVVVDVSGRCFIGATVRGRCCAIAITTRSSADAAIAIAIGGDAGPRMIRQSRRVSTDDDEHYFTSLVF